MTDPGSHRYLAGATKTTAAAPSIPCEYATLPASAPAVIKNHTISIQASDKIQPVVDNERRRTFHALVRRYMNQLLYGCQRELCDTRTCYTFRKCLSRDSSASRQLTHLSARIIACSLATQDDPLKSLCPGKPVVPTLNSEKGGSGHTRDLTDELDDEEKENRPNGGDERRRSWKGEPQQKEVSVVGDKGLKDTRSFTQQLFSTMAMKMVEWISLPPPNRTFGPSSPLSEAEDHKNNSDNQLLSPQEPPKFKFLNNPMEVMDTGRLSRDSEPVSQVRHQEILQQQPRKRGPCLKEVTPTLHSNAAKAKLTTPVSAFAMAPPPPLNMHHGHQGRKAAPVVQVTPSRGEKNTQTLWEPVDTITPPQSLELLDEGICKALVDMCTNPRAAVAERRDARQFAKQSILYVFSTPEALLSSFGGIGSTEVLDFDPNSVSKALDTLYRHGWEEGTKRSMWAGLAHVFAKPGKGMSNKDAAGILVLSLHTLASGLVKDEELFRIVTGLRASGRVSSLRSNVMPDIGLDDELAERLMKRILRALSFRRNRPKDNTILYVKQYLRKCEQALRKERDERILKELGPDMVGQVSDEALKGDISLARCTLEWTRAVFIRSWDGHEVVKRKSLAGSCIEMFELLYTDHDSYGLFPAAFETKSIGERINASIWPVDWYHATTPLPSPDDIHLLDHQYLFPIPYSVTFFRAINLDIMKNAYETAIASIRMAGQMSELTNVGYPILAAKIDTALSTYLVLTVRRVNLLEDALNQLVHREHRELVRPLKVRFAEGEEGVDQGGVQQEFFSLLMMQILRPEYGLFVTDERTRLSWFSESSLEATQKFELVGLVMGLAVYNGITLPVSFPKALYIKLLGGTPTLNDIDDNWPELAKGLRAMLKWNGGDVGDIFMRTYEYSYSVFGQVRSINMLDAEANGLEFLPPPLPSVKMKPPVPSGAPSDWLPTIIDSVLTDPTNGWLHDLGQFFGTLTSEDEARLHRLRSGETRYTISYLDLNAASEAGEATGQDGVLEGANSRNRPEVVSRVREIPEGSSGNSSNGRTSHFQHGKDDSPSDGSGSERSWQTEEDEMSIPVHVKLPSDDGEDWDDRSTSYSPTGSAYERDLETVEAPPLEFDTKESLPIAGPGAVEVERSEELSHHGTSSDLASAVAIPLPPTHPATPSSDKSQVEGFADDTNHRSVLGGNTSASELKHEEPLEVEEAPLVTNANREQYATDYISWLTDRSIRRQYLAFRRGFFAVNSLRSLKLFDATSLQALVEGESGGKIDIAELERVCKYEDGYDTNHRVIRDFWEVVKAFNEEKKRLLLEFVTSSARIPIGGLEKLMFHIVRNGEDSERLPSSLTCFGRLLLPEYASKKKLTLKLLLALENGKGFGNP